MMPSIKNPFWEMPVRTPIKTIGDYRQMVLEVLMYRVDYENYHNNPAGAEALRKCLTEIHSRNFETEGALSD